MASRILDILERGEVFQKFHDRESRVATRFVWADLGESRLYWCKEGSRVKSANHSAALADLEFVSTTRSAAIFDHNAHASRAPAELVLTLELDGAGGERTIVLQAPTEQVRDAWQASTSRRGAGARAGGANLAVEVADEEYRQGGAEKKYGGGATPSPGAPQARIPSFATDSTPIPEEEEFSDDDQVYAAAAASASSPLQQMFAAAPAQQPRGAAPAASRPIASVAPMRHQSSHSSPSSSSRPPSAFDRTVLPNPLPAQTQHVVDIALASVFASTIARIKQKAEDQASSSKKLAHLTRVNEELARKNEELEAQLARVGGEGLRSHGKLGELQAQLAHYQELEVKHELEWNSLAVATGSEERGKIEIRLATANLEHEAPHQYVALLYVKHPLEDAFEYSQTVSLMRSADGVTYLPKLVLSPTELFAFRHAEDDEDEDQDEGDDDESGSEAVASKRRGSLIKKKAEEHAQEGELVGAQLKVEIWDLINKQMYGDLDDERSHRTPRSLNSSHEDDDDLETTGYQGHVDFDMNELIASKHHVLSLPVSNTLSSRKEAEWAEQKIRLVLQYCLPVTEDDLGASGAGLSEKQRAKGASSALLAGGSSDPLLTLRLQDLEEQLDQLQKVHAEVLEDHALYKEQAAQFAEERKIRLALEQRLVNEQIIRVKHEQEVMRLKPRALELVDTSDELVAARRKIRDVEFTVSTLQKELRKQTLPPTPHAMLDELLHLSNPGLVDLLRIKKFILEQERVRAMLVEEMSSNQKHFVTYETTHDELIRRENALNTHCHWLEDEKRKLEVQNQELIASLHQLQSQTLQLSKRCQTAESAKELMHVNLSYLTDQQKIHRKKIDELERALLVHHGQMTHFEYAKLPVPQQVLKTYKAELGPEYEDEPDEPEEPLSLTMAMNGQDQPTGAAADGSMSVRSTADGSMSVRSASGSPVLEANGSNASNGPNGSAPAAAAQPPPPRRTRIVYSDSLEQTLAAAGSNWPAHMQKQ
jgi:hypothetical protein